MTPDHLSATPSMIFMAIVAAALVAHGTRLAGPARLVHGLYALIATGLFYLFGAAAFGWNLVPREALFGVYALAFAAVAGLALSRRGGPGFPAGSLLIQLAAMAYMWAPANYWKPPLVALFLLYFIVELAGWIRGHQPAPADDEDSRRPPLIPPKPVRGVREMALAGAGAALVYVFAAGMGSAPVAATPPAEQAASQPPAAEPAVAETAEAQPQSDAQPAPPETAANTAETPAAPEAAPLSPPAAAAPSVYTSVAGDTLKSIAKKVYGKPEKWRAIASANPGIKPGAKLKAGQSVTLPEPPTR